MVVKVGELEIIDDFGVLGEKENFYEFGGHLNAYDNPEFWKKFGKVYNIKKGLEAI